MTVREALRLGAARLATAGVDNPRLDARLLLARAAGLGQAALLAEPDRSVDPDSYEALLARRLSREPVAYILGMQEFWSLPFLVSPSTLIPRADSEAVVEAALDAHPAPRRVLDLGTGTGCLLLAVLHERPAAWGLGVDRAPERRHARPRQRRGARSCELRRRADCRLGGGAGGDIRPDAIQPALCGIGRDGRVAARGRAAGSRARPSTAARTDSTPTGPWPRCSRDSSPSAARRCWRLALGRRSPSRGWREAAGLHLAGLRRDLAGVERALVLRAD